ncbi:hypothetical protein DF182_31230 [Chitinophaga flava]|uniref:Uncharacterized protein n=1 Tax=Chitinophaga flava TaxID=2259036 RepID=A0A365XPE1_9BACT|nr:hypothetical protein DF182_31230 [Chitinophaga flava]
MIVKEYYANFFVLSGIMDNFISYSKLQPTTISSEILDAIFTRNENPVVYKWITFIDIRNILLVTL